MQKKPVIARARQRIGKLNPDRTGEGHRVTYRLPDGEREAIDRLAAARGINRSDYLRELVQRELSEKNRDG